MQVFSRRMLGFVAVAVLASDALACSDIKIFFAPGPVKRSGLRIDRERALDIQSEFVKREGLELLADDADEYYAFDLDDLNGVCEFPINKACSFLNCGCDEPETAKSSRDLRSILCFPEWCVGTTSGSAVDIDEGPREEVIVTFCFGDECTGFLYPLGAEFLSVIIQEYVACFNRLSFLLLKSEYNAGCCVRKFGLRFLVLSTQRINSRYSESANSQQIGMSWTSQTNLPKSNHVFFFASESGL
ncbi:hypothetical protein BSKO_12553 [Bryopsis sp. KO-2023]|nr:hypothetical protein BSKO_12553 [Bryopsis sp. KO-2023]